jgi:cold shock CspA family protein
VTTAREEDAFAPEPIGGPPLIGDVVQFDDAAGVGVVELGPGRTVDFHCTAITDGSRSIDVGQVVAVVIRPGHHGRLEAGSVRPLPGVARPGSTLAVTVSDGAPNGGSDQPPGGGFSSAPDGGLSSSFPSADVSSPPS